MTTFVRLPGDDRLIHLDTIKGHSMTHSYTNTTVLRLPFFVYGTLRPDQGNDALWHDYATPVGDGVVFVRGFKLVGRGFPYAIPSTPDDTSIGCLVVPHADDYHHVMSRMDALEGVPTHYERVMVPVWTTEHDAMPFAAWMYSPAHGRNDYDKMTPVPGNDWSNAYGYSRR